MAAGAAVHPHAHGHSVSAPMLRVGERNGEQNREQSDRTENE